MKLDGKCGHIDPTGKMVVPLQFSEAFGFSEGLAEVNEGTNGATLTRRG